MTAATCTDPVALNLWHPVDALVDLAPGIVNETVLMSEPVSYGTDEQGALHAWRSTASLPRGQSFAPGDIADPLWTTAGCGLLWTSLGTPEAELFTLPEFEEPDRHNVWTGGIGVSTSAPRAVENFLDMGHFPYVHTGYLGIEPRTEVKAYEVDLTNNGREILATECEFFQPLGALNADGGMLMGYVYRVPHPYCAILFKSSPIDESRMDAIAIFCQPVDEVTTRAHMLLSMLDDENDDRLLKRFQLLIFAQDKPILENQRPKRLPLGSRIETPVSSDKTSITYRRWLSEMGLTYCVIPAEA